MGIDKNPEEKILSLQKKIDYYCYMRILANKFTNEQLSQLYDEIEDAFSWGGWFEIVDSPKGEKQTEKDDTIEVWINQTTNGGYTGDSFAGDVYVKLSENEYLTWGYEE